MNDATKTIERLVTAAETGRLRADLIDRLEEEPFSLLQEWSDEISEVASQVSTVIDAIGTWQDAEGREERADARDEACAEIDMLVTAWNGATLDLATLADFDDSDAALDGAYQRTQDAAMLRSMADALRSGSTIDADVLVGIADRLDP